jgi:hypothetical protein
VIGEIYNKQVVDLITPRDGEVISITPNHLSKHKSNDPPHASYMAEWTTSVKRNESADSFGNEKRFANITDYTSYEVTARLNGKQRTYRALVLYHASEGKLGSYQTEEERSARLARVEILDNVTSEINTVLKDESPYARAPWATYSKSSLYHAVIRSITETKQANSPLIPADAPIGYLPGDGVSVNTTDLLMLAAETNCSTQVDRIQYQDPATSTFVDISGTLYVPKGQSVTFKALPNPPGAAFAAGQPVWGGSSGATGSGDTIPVNFTTESSSTTDYKTVTATSGNTKTVNVVVFTLTPVLTPDDEFSGRSHVNFGLQEHVNLSFTVTPEGVTAANAGGIKWLLTNGSGRLNAPNSDGTGTYDAPETAGSATLKLEIQSGPAKGGGYFRPIGIIAPTFGYMSKEGGTYLRHVQNTWSIGFLGVIHLEPRNVSFGKLGLIEDEIGATGQGWLVFLTGEGHHPSTRASAIACYSNTGCESVESDQIWTGAYGGPGLYGDGDVQWLIPLNYTTTSGSKVQMTTVTQHATSTSTGKATIEKGGAGPFSIESTAYSSGYNG